MKTPESSCDFCSESISPADFDRGRAVRVLNKVYCQNCMTRAIERSRTPGMRPDFSTPPPRPIDPLPRRKKQP